MNLKQSHTKNLPSWLRLPGLALAMLFIAFTYSCGTSRPAKKSASASYRMKVYDGEANPSDSLFYNALRQKFSNEPQDALASLKKFSRINPNEPAPYYQMAVIYFENLSNPQEALKWSERAFKMNPRNKWYRILYADLLASTGQFAKGARLYDELIGGKNYQKEYLLKQMVYYERAGNYNKILEIIDMMDQYTDMETEDLDGFRLEVYKAKGDRVNTERMLKKMVDQHPDDYSKKLLLAEFYEQTKQPKKAEEIYSSFKFDESREEDKAIYIYTLIQRKDTHNLFRIADELYSGQKADTAEIDAFQTGLLAAVEKHPYIIEPFINRLGRISQRKDAYFYAPEFIVGYYAIKNNQDSVAKYAIRSFELGSDNVSLYGSVISYYLVKEEYDSLIDFSEKAASKRDSFSIGYYGAALGYFNKKDNINTLKYLRLASDYAGSLYLDNYKSDIYAMMGDVYHSENDHTRSDSAYDIALKYNPRNATALNNYAYYLSVRNERLKTAEEMSFKSLSIEENQPSYLDTYGWIKYQLGEYEEAKKYIRKAIEFSTTPSAELWEHLGDVEQKLGNSKKAIEYWKLSIESGGNKEHLNKKIQEHEKS